MKTAISIPRLIPAFALVGLLLLASIHTAFATGTPANPPAGSTFDQRLAQRKAEQNEQLSAQTQQHIQQVCGTEQNSIRQLQQHATSVGTNRVTTYQKIDGYILISIGQLKLAGQDTFTLEQDRATLVQKVATFETTSTNYQQTLGDLLVVNCQADPVGFQALLDTARAYYTLLGSQSSDISQYITNTLQPVMQGFVSQLQPQSDSGGSN